MTIALIDGDSLVYRSGFASDATAYLIAKEGFTIKVYSKREAKEICDEMGVPYNNILEAKEYEPVENCLHTIKITIKKIMEATNASEFRIFLSGSANFRNDVATIRDYKGNRDPNNRPHWYNEMRQYLIDVYKAEVSDNEEADDVLGYTGYNNPDCVLCHLDKDINMIPGEHYNWDKNESYSIDDLTASRIFYTQLITGDTSDNIEGLAEQRPKKRTFQTKPLEGMTTEKEMYDYVFEGYALKYCDDAAEAMLENARLLWIRREPHQLWSAPNG